MSESGASVLVLEANNYIGGRAKTVNDASSGTQTDLGSSWLYTDSNMESYLAKNGFIDAALENDQLDTEYGESLLFSQSEVGVEQAILLDDDDELLSTLWGGFLSFKKTLLKALGDVSYEDALDQFMEENGITDNEDQQYLNLLLESGEEEYAGDSSLLSLSEVTFWELEECFSDTHYMSIPGGGFGNYAASFAEEIEADIKLNSKVSNIVYNDSSVAISYEENGITEDITAQSALVTVSLGVLQAGTINFSPSLPEWKQDAIDSMGFGLLNKCVLYWKNDDDIVWPVDKYWFELITPEDESSGMWTSFFNPTKLSGVPSLVGWIAGDEAAAMEDQTDEENLE